MTGAIVPPAWTEQASCASIGGDIFYPEGQGARAKPAKDICEGCPVRVECLEMAIAHQDRWGVWGGLSERERAAIERERRPA